MIHGCRGTMYFIIQTSIFILTNISQAMCCRNHQKDETGDIVTLHDGMEDGREDNTLMIPTKVDSHTESSNAHLDQHRPNNCEPNRLQPPCGKNAPTHVHDPGKETLPLQQDKAAGHVVHILQDDTIYLRKASTIQQDRTTGQVHQRYLGRTRPQQEDRGQIHRRYLDNNGHNRNT